jgi:hypothetical protein
VPASLSPPEVEEPLPVFADGRGSRALQPQCDGQALVVIA